MLFTPSLSNQQQLKASSLKQLEFLSNALHEEKVDVQLQSIYPEGFLFYNLMYGLSWTEIARLYSNDTVLFNKAKQEAQFAFENVHSDLGKSIFDASMLPEYGIFYNGWENYLLGKMIQADIVKDTISIALFKQNCASMADVFLSSPTPFLDSYPGMSWPSDATVAIAALSLHDRVFEPLYDSCIQDWLSKIKVLLDTNTLLMPHMTISGTGQLAQGSRGSSMSLMLIFLSEINPVFAQQQFELFQQHFSHTILGLPAIREYPEGVKGSGDIDSGPVIFGMSFSGTIVSVGTFNKFGANNQADKLNACIESFGFPLSGKNEKKFAFGKFPVADAFILWAKLQSPEPYFESRNEDVNFGKTLWFHLVSMLIFIWLIIRFRKRLIQLFHPSTELE